MSASKVESRRSAVAETVHLRKQRQARLEAAARLNWQFWRWRPKLSLCTLQILALLIGSIVLVYQRSQPWRAGMMLGGKTYPLTAVRFSGDGKILMTAGGDGMTRIYDADTGVQKSMIDHKMRIVAADLSPDGKQLAVMTEDSHLDVSAVGDGSPISTNHLYTWLDVRMLRFSKDSTRLAVTYVVNDGHIDVICLDGRSPEIQIDELSDTVCSCEFSSDGERVVTASANGSVHVWDAVRTPRGFGQALVYMRGDKNIFRSAVVSPDGKFIATAGKDCTVRLWNACFGSETRSIIDPPAPDSPETSNGRMWMAKPLAILKGHQQYVLSSQFSPDGARLATVSLDGSVRVWDGRNGAALSVLSTQGPWRSVTFSPDGKRIAAGGIDGSVQIWDRRCVERWYGKLALPEFWLLLAIIPALFWSIRRDARALGVKSSIVGVDPSTAL